MEHESDVLVFRKSWMVVRSHKQCISMCNRTLKEFFVVYM